MKKLLSTVLAIGLLTACQGNADKNDKTEDAGIKKTNAAKTKAEKTPEKTVAKKTPEKTVANKTPEKTPEKPEKKPEKKPTKRKGLTKEDIKKLVTDKSKADLKDFRAEYSYYLGYNLGGNIKNSLVDPKGLKGFKSEPFFEGYSDAISGKKPKLYKTAKNYKKIEADAEKNSYVIGFGMGKGHLVYEIDLSIMPYAKGLKLGLAGKDPQLSDEEMTKIYNKFKEIQQKKDYERMKAIDEAGKKYLSDNKKKKGVVTTKSGLQYKVLRKGTGKTPSATDTVKVHYKGTLIGGKVFDSSYKRKKPAEFPLNGVIKGWTEGLQLMKVGSKYEFTIPSDLAYGRHGSGSVPPNSTLVYIFELLEIIKNDSGKNNTPDTKKPKDTNGKEKFTTTASGLKYAVLRKGKGKRPKATDTVEVNYEGTLLNGKVFDSSYKRGESISFALNQVIKGWTEGLQLMKEGAKYKFIIPSKLGYGAHRAGSIPPNSTLIFIVELIKVK